MALSVKINITDLRLSTIPANTKVADIVASGGTAPYTYSLASGGDLFQVSGTTIVTKVAVSPSNTAPFSVTVNDSTSTSVTSDEYYASLQYESQYRFTQANTIYKITKDIDLGHTTLTIQEGCTLDFQGGSISNGVIVGTKTAIESPPYYIFKNITFTGSWKTPLNAYWVGVNEVNNDNGPFLKFLSYDETKLTVHFPQGNYLFTSPVFLHNYKTITGDGKSTLLSYSNPTDNDAMFQVGNQDMDDFTVNTGTASYYITIKDMRISGDNKTVNFISGGIRESVFENLELYNWNTAFLLNNSWSLRFNGLKIYDCIIILSSGQEFNDVSFEKCYFSASTTGFVDFMGQSILFNGCSFKGFSTYVFLPIYQRVPWNGLRLDGLNIVGCYIETNSTFFSLYNYDFKMNGLNIVGNTFNMTRSTNPAFNIYNCGISIPSGNISSNKFRIYGDNRYPLMRIKGKTNIAVLYNDCTAGYVNTIGESPYPLWDEDNAQLTHNAIAGEVRTIHNTNNIATQEGWLNKGEDLFYDNNSGIQQPSWLAKEGVHEILALTITGDAAQAGNIVINAGGATYTVPIVAGATNAQILQSLLRFDYGLYLPSLDAGIIYLSSIYRGVRPAPSVTNTIGVTSSIIVNRTGVSNKWVNAFGQTPHVVKGTSAQRPTLNNDNDYGAMFFDADLGKPIWWNGSSWLYSDGWSVNYLKVGGTSSRPVLNANQVPFQYYDTDLKKFINWNGTAWVNLDGTALV